MLPLIGYQSFYLLETAVAFLLVSFSVLRTWLGFLPAWDLQVVGSFICRQLNYQVGGPKICPDRNVGCTPFGATYCQTKLGALHS